MEFVIIDNNRANREERVARRTLIKKTPTQTSLHRDYSLAHISDSFAIVIIKSTLSLY